MSERRARLPPAANRPLPDSLRAAVVADSRPVLPLLSPASRAALVLGVSLMTGLAMIMMVGLRADRTSLDAGLLWFPAAARLLAGTFLLFLALREGVPSAGLPRRVGSAALVGAPVLLAILAEWVALVSSASASSAVEVSAKNVAASPHLPAGNILCYPMEILMTIPALAVVSWLLSRAFPLRRVFAVACGALGTALVADSFFHVTCPSTALRHTLFVHGGAVATMAIAAALVAWMFQGRSKLR